MDILVKFRDRYTRANRVRTPQHIHWVIDLLIKKEHDKALTLSFIRYLLNMYDEKSPSEPKKNSKDANLDSLILQI